MKLNPVSLAQTARLYLHTIREIVTDADDPTAFAAECATATLDSLDVLQTALEERAREQAASRPLSRQHAIARLVTPGRHRKEGSR